MALAPHKVHARLAFAVVSATIAAASTAAFVFKHNQWGADPVDVFAGVAWGGLIVAIVVLILVERSIIRGLMRLNQAVDKASREDDDEELSSVGDLEVKFESFLSRVEHRRSEAVRCARIAGMSDVSSALLHGAGTTLNNIKTALTQMDRQIQRMGVRDIGLLVSELDQHADQLEKYLTKDRRGRFLIPYLRAMSESLEELQGAMTDELGSLRDGVGHIAELLHAQQTHVVGASLPERVELAEELENAYTLCQQTFDPEGKQNVRRHFDAVPHVVVDRYKLHGILLAMIQNAFESVAKRPAGTRQIALRVYRMYAEGCQTIAIEVKDTGVGITPDQLSRVFEDGYTTKEAGGGHGLHLAANSAKEIGGFMRVRSTGTFEGASQILHLPLVVDSETTGAPLPPKKRGRVLEPNPE